MPKVSVIIPVYNVETYIKRCLKSVLQQSFTDYEIICVDDCGQDKSIELAEELQQRFPERIRIVGGDVNRGLGGAREVGMRAASGTYICFIDSDDFIEKNYLETYVRFAEESCADVVVGGYIRTEGDKNYIRPVSFRDVNFYWVYPSACTKLYRKSFLDTHGIDFRGLRRYEDEWFNYRILINHPNIIKIPYEGYHYYLNPNSITKSTGSDRTRIYEEYELAVRDFLDHEEKAVRDSKLLQYCIASALNANLLYNGHGCGSRRMKELYYSYRTVLESLPTDIADNPFVSLRRLPSEARKNRYAAWLVFRAKKLRLDSVLFLLAAHIH